MIEDNLTEYIYYSETGSTRASAPQYSRFHVQPLDVYHEVAFCSVLVHQYETYKANQNN
jgi:hypothetical protein